MGGEWLLIKIGDINAVSMHKGAGAAGFMEGASLIPVYDTLPGEYSDEARDVMQAAKEKSAYTVGNLAGMGAQFAVGGTNTLANSIVGKVLPKVTSKAGKFVARRGAEMLTESGVDISDAYKQAVDRDGNIDWDKFQQNIIMNVGLNVGMGIGMDTASKLMTRWNANRLFKLENKQALGTITDKELIELGQIRSKLLEKADDTMNAGSDAAKETLEKSNSNKVKRYSELETEKNEIIGNHTRKEIDSNPKLAKRINDISTEQSGLFDSYKDFKLAEVRLETADRSVSRRLTSEEDDEAYLHTQGHYTKAKEKYEEEIAKGEIPICHSEEDISKIIHKYMETDADKSKKVPYGYINNRLADDIQKIDPELALHDGFLTLVPSNIHHAWKKHSIDDFPLTESDMEHVTDYIDTYDEVITVQHKKNEVL